MFGFTDSPLALDHFKLNSENYSIILTDYKMPILDGIQLLKEVKSINPKVKTLLMSAFNVEDRLFEECNCIHKMLQMPISIVDLINEVETLISSSMVVRQKNIN